MMIIIAITVKCTSRGPIIFKQPRITRNQKQFNIYKFRTMRVDAEKFGPELSHGSGKGDERLTKVGAFLRRHHRLSYYGISRIPQ